MTDTDKHNLIRNTLEINCIDCTTVAFAMMDELTYDELLTDKASEVIAAIHQYEQTTKTSKYPDQIMRTLRQRRGLKIFDTSRDDQLNQLSCEEALNEVCTWNGLIGYGSTVKGWVEAIYGLNLTEMD